MEIIYRVKRVKKVKKIKGIKSIYGNKNFKRKNYFKK